MGDRFGIWGVVDFLLASPIPISFLIPHATTTQNKIIPKPYQKYSLFLLYIHLHLHIYHFISSSFFSFIFFHIYSFFPSYNSFYITSCILLSLHSRNSSTPSHTYFIYILCISISLIWPCRALRFSFFAFRFSLFGFSFSVLAFRFSLFLLRSRLLSCSRLLQQFLLISIFLITLLLSNPLLFYKSFH